MKALCYGARDMRIRSGGPLAGPGPVGRREDTRRSEAAPRGTSAPSDSASIMGVPEAELTPNVQRALLSLMGEVDQLRRETEALRGRMRELESLADRDAFLPVLNRRAFLREVSKALSLAERHDAPSSLIYLDLNGFKQINDQHGHAAGDAALEQVAALITDHVRETDAVGRLGGDEFGIVLTLTPESAAKEKARDLSEAISESAITHKGQKLALGAAWGVHPLSSGIAVEDAIAAADAAMYAHKQAAKDRAAS